MAKNILRHVGTVLLFTVGIGSLAPITQIIEDWLALAADPFASLAFYGQPWYWLTVLAGVCVIYPIVIYFKDVNPRTFVHIYDLLWTSVFMCLLIGAEAIALLYALIGLSEHKALLVIALIACGVTFLFGIYAIMCRGVAIYQKGKVRVFKFRIYTYHTDTIDDFRLEYQGRKCCVYIVVQGVTHTFRISKSTAGLIEARLEMLKAIDEIQEVEE